MADPVTLMILGTGALVAVSAALLGTFLVLRGESMSGDAISHAIVLGIVLTWMATGARSGPLAMGGAVLAGLAAVFGAAALARTGLLRRDTATGLVFPAMFALGVLLINLHARNLHLDVDTVLLGEIGFVWLDTVTLFGLDWPRAGVTLAAVGAVNAALVALFWKELKIAAFDPGLAQALGFRPGLVGLGLLAMTSATAVAAFDAVGVVLFLAFLIVPAVTGRLAAASLGGMLAVALASGLAAVGLGYAAAVAADVSLGGSMALATGLGLGLALVAAPQRGAVAVLLRRRARRGDALVDVLLAHLAAHEGTPRAPEECTPEALVGHLHWPAARAGAVVVAALDRGLIRREGAQLALTRAGRALARAEARRHDRRRASEEETR